ncbi:MAG: hypothetical protein N3H31_02370 [Candidatus Nezhaarchaeota archaeon]|nr:hypothetical protein [Candidatus Nezhaarchaeota archaeon]
MPTCPECGGELKFDRSHYAYVCRACGLSLTRGEYERAQTASRRSEEDEEESRREYLKWWLRSKK